MPHADHWNEHYRLNLRDIDMQHQRFFGLIDEIFDSLERGTNAQDALIAITHLADYAYYHFATEEQYFETYAYADRDEHRKLHEVFTGRSKDFLERCRKPGEDIQALLQEAGDFSIDWLMHHILVEDKKYVSFFREHHLS